MVAVVKASCTTLWNAIGVDSSALRLILLQMLQATDSAVQDTSNANVQKCLHSEIQMRTEELRVHDACSHHT